MSHGIYSTLGAASGLILFMILYFITKKLRLKVNVFSLSKSEIVFITIYVVFLAFLMSVIYSVGIMIGGYEWGRIASFVALIAGLSSIYFILYISTQKTVILNIKRREEQQEILFHAQTRNYQRIIEKDDELRTFRHNIRDEIKFLSTILGDVNINDRMARQEARDYINRVSATFLEIEQITGHDTGSHAVNASWFDFTTTNQYLDITAVWKGKLPDHLNIDNRNLVLLFANVLSNAFEAASQSQNDKYVTVEVKSNLQGFSVSIKNSYNGKIKRAVSGDFLTSKPEKKSHGIGTQIIKKVVENHQGHVDFRYDENEFVTLITFN